MYLKYPLKTPVNLLEFCFHDLLDTLFKFSECIFVLLHFNVFTIFFFYLIYCTTLFQNPTQPELPDI